MRSKWGKSRGGMPVRAAGKWGGRGASRGREILSSGEGSPSRRRGFARRQVRAPGQARTESPPQRPRELASARTASGHEHQGDDAKPRLDSGKPKILAPARFGEKCAPRTTSEEWCLVSRNLSRAPT